MNLNFILSGLNGGLAIAGIITGMPEWCVIMNSMACGLCFGAFLFYRD